MNTFQGGQWTFIAIAGGILILLIIGTFITVLVQHHEKKNHGGYGWSSDATGGTIFAWVVGLVIIAIMVGVAFGTNDAKNDDAWAKADVKHYNSEIARVVSINRKGEHISYVDHQNRLCETAMLKDSNEHWYIVRRNPLRQCTRAR